jgi:DNA-binding SARP family transcriptional activator
MPGGGCPRLVMDGRGSEHSDLAVDVAPRAVPRQLSIHLLAAPRVTYGQDEQPAPRGRKAWALLAYILGTETVPSREWLAELLFSDADDPLNALSWSLSQLRRLLGTGVSIGGDPVQLRLPPGTFVDIRAVRSGSWAQVLDLPGLGRPLLEGMAFASCPAFEVWLLAERRHLAGVADDVLREATRARLAAGDARRAVELASRLVAANPLDEDSQELLIRAYARADDRVAAVQQRDACVALFRRELGTAPGQAVLHAADAETPSAPPAHPLTKAGIVARLEAGLTAMDAGAIDAAILALRQATSDAHEAADPVLEARTLVALGSALVHGVRGRDGEGAEILHEAIAAAERAGKPALAAQAYRELGYVELLRARYDRAQRWIRKAVDLAADDLAELAWAHAIQGLALSDVGRHSDALHELQEALSLARQAGVGDAETWALTFIGRIHLLRRDLVAARVALREALSVASRARWTAFVPLPEALLAEVDLMEGRVDDAATAYEHAYALGVQLGDPCWEGIAARGLGLVANRRGDRETALRWVAEARTRCTRLPDAWLWVEGYCLDALCTLATEYGRQEATPWIADLEALATRGGMRELIARAYMHRGNTGDAGATDAARVLAAEVDNPAILAADR